MPTDMPAIVASASGVSCTRSLAEARLQPRGRAEHAAVHADVLTDHDHVVVVLHFPAMRHCDGLDHGYFRQLNDRWIVRWASRRICAPPRAARCRCARQLGEQMIEHGIGRGLRAASSIRSPPRRSRGRIPASSACSSASLQAPALTRYSRKRSKGSSAQASLTSSGRAVAAGVVRGRVIAQAVGQRLDQSRARRRAARASSAAADRVAHGEHVVAVDLDARDARGHGLLRQGAGRGLLRDGHRDRPAVVHDHEDHGQRARAGQVQRLVKRALRGAAVADVGERAARLACAP